MTPHIAWAFRQRSLEKTQRLVLIALADRANGEGVCISSFVGLAHECEISTRSAVTAVEALCTRRLIEKITDPAQRVAIRADSTSLATRSNVYRVLRPIEDDEARQARLQRAGGRS